MFGMSPSKLKCIIVDDEPLAVSLLSNYVQKIPFLDLVFSSENPLEALEFIQKNEADFIFLDIQMPELSGINFMEIVGKKLKYILTTAYSEYALDGYEHSVIDYLLKPISFDRFYKSCQKAQDRFAIQVSQVDNFFFVKASGQQHRINFEDILYVESIKDYVNISTHSGEYIVSDTLINMEAKLPTDFVRIHKSFIVNLKQVMNFKPKELLLSNNKILPIGERYKNEFFRRLI